MAESGGMSAPVSYRWIANSLIGLLSLVIIAALGWVGATLTALADKIETLQDTAQLNAYKVSQIQTQLTAYADKLDALQAKLNQTAFEADTTQDWVEAQLKANAATTIIEGHARRKK